MTPLRQRMTDDLKLRNYSSNTVDSYVRAVRKFAEFHGRSPEELGPEQVRQFLLHLVEERRVPWRSFALGAFTTMELSTFCGSTKKAGNRERFLYGMICKSFFKATSIPPHWFTGTVTPPSFARQLAAPGG